MSTTVEAPENRSSLRSDGAIPVGYKRTEVGIIPEDWVVDGIVATTPHNLKNGIVDGPFGSNLKTIHYKKSGVPIITSGYVTEGVFRATDYLYVDAKKFKQEKRSAVRPGDIVMTKIGARCGASAILPAWHETGILSGNALKITVDATRHSAYYVWQVLWNLYQNGKVEPLKTVGAQPAISMANLKKYRIPLPKRKEQEAIAAALSDVDGLIGALENLIAKKRAIKLATMQQLLTGQVRLPRFEEANPQRKRTDVGEIPENWGVHVLGDEIESLEAGVSVNSVDDEMGVHAGDVYILKTSAVFNGTFNPNECKKVAPRDIGRVRLSPRANCIVISRMNTPELVGECGYVDKNYPYLFLPDRLWMTRFRTRSEVCPKWLTYVLSSTVYKRKLKDAATGTTGNIKNIIQAAFLALRIPWPESKEQCALADTLSDMDAEICALDRRLDKIKSIKQGMMQALLTGRIRLAKPEVAA